jgi:hypothetical protein
MRRVLLLLRNDRPADLGVRGRSAAGGFVHVLGALTKRGLIGTAGLTDEGRRFADRLAEDEARWIAPSLRSPPDVPGQLTLF